MTKIERFFANLKEKKVAFIGTGVTNNDIIRLFLKKGISITLLDRKTPEKLGAIYEELKAAGVAFQLGDTYLDHLTDLTLYSVRQECITIMKNCRLPESRAL